MKPKAHGLIAVLGCGLLAFSAASARADDNPQLHGLNTFQVLSDIAGSSNSSCNPTKDDVATSIRYTLAPISRIHIVSNSSTWLYASITITDNCAAASVVFEVDADVTVNANQQDYVGATIWEDNFVLSGSPNDSSMRDRVLAIVEQMTKKFAADWTAANP